MDAPPRPGPGGRFRWTVALFALALLAPVWLLPVPPLQDYAEHLAQARALARPGTAPDLVIDRRPGPGALFGLVAGSLARWLPIETAGRVYLSAALLLFPLLILRAARRSATPGDPWALVWLCPVAFQQPYFMGNPNYLVAVPLVLLAVLDLDDVAAAGAPLRARVTHAGWQLALFLAHPLGVLAYLGLAGLLALIRGRARAALTTAAGLAIPFAGWLSFSCFVNSGIFLSAPVWPPPSFTLACGLLPLTGMRWSGGFDPLTLACALAATLLCVRAARRSGDSRDRFWGAAAGATAAAALVSPGTWAGFHYLNTRLWALAWGACLLGQAELRFGPRAAFGLVATAALTQAASLGTQAQVAREMAEVLPLIARIPPAARLLSLVFDAGSPALERAVLSPHLHAAAYHDVRGGPGLTAYRFDNALQPVRPRPGSMPPVPGELTPERFRLDEHGRAWDHVLVRSAPDPLTRELTARGRLLGEAGAWRLWAIGAAR